MADVIEKHTIDIELYKTEAAEWETDTEEIDECKVLCEELKIEGQKGIFDNEGGLPFPRLSEAEKNVWKAFCPHTSAIDRYGQTVIPLRVLNVYKECLEHSYFQDYEIWSESETNPDPVLVGVVWVADKTWDKSYYLIARWGESLATWIDIVKSAREKWVRKTKNKLNSEISKAKSKIEEIEHLADKHLEGTWVDV